MVTIIIDKTVTLAIITMVIFATCGVHGYGNGNIPPSACQSMFPEHGAPAKTSPSPYNVTVSKTSYGPEDTVTVTIAGGKFEGFMVEARRADPSLNTLEALGTFTPVNNTHQLCNGGALSHTDDFERESISFDWIAPTAAEGHIQFRATVVEEEEDFWVDVKSPIVRDPTAPRISERPPAQDCGGAGGCFMHPTGCKGDACVASITWTPEGSATTPAYVDITLTGASDGYVAVGLSTDQSMGSDSVMECVNDGGTVTARMSYNEGHTNQENKFTEGISDVTGSVVNGKITCSFRRRTSVAGKSTIFPLDTAYYLLVALGDYSEGRKQQHVTHLSSAQQFRLTEVSAGAGGGGGTSDCGGAGGCFMHPTGCQGDACVASITWTPEGSATTPAYVDITLTGDTDGYVAVGLSTDQGMGTDSVMECVNDGGTVRARMSYNEGHTNQDNKFTEGISDVTGSVVNGTITCSFRRMTSVAGNSKIFPLDTAYYLLVALGDYSEGRKQQHVTHLSSAQQFRLTEVSAGAGGGGGTSDCGGAAGCFMDPSGCQGDACVASITWTPEGFTSGRKRRQTATTPAYVDITLTGDTDGYVAVGLSADQSMGTDSVMECVNDGVTVTALMSYNEGRNNQENKFTDGISNVTGSVVNGRITCSFRRMTSVAGNSKIFPLDTDYYLLVALGAISGENKQLHTNRLSSANKYRLTEASTGGGGAATGSGYGLVQAHAILMVAAWLLTGCLGMMMARYYKQGWPDKTMCGTKVWFNVHRVLMILTLFLTLAGFIVIFIHVKGYSGHLEGFLAAHPPLGIVVTALVIINPIMAAFRPHPGTSKRTMFNWAHWAVANLALILAVICIGFGFYIPTVAAFAPEYLDIFWIFIGMIVFQALVWIVLDIHRRVSNSRTKKEYDIQLKDRQDMGEQVPPTPTNTGSTFPYVMLGIFILGTLGFFLAIAVFLCI